MYIEKTGGKMVFSSTVFLFMFLPITLIGYYLLKIEYRNYWLLLMSLLFFAWSQPKYLWIIIVSIFINYIGALFIGRIKTGRKASLWMIVLLNLGMLFYYKYFNFTIDSANGIFGTSFEFKDIILPVGISFFTFQGLSYVVDVYREEVSVQKNPLKVGLYIALFPQLIAGPIVRYKSIAEEIDERHFLFDDFCSGIERFIIGLGKKAIIANTVALTADAIWTQAGGTGNNPVSIAWLGSIAYTLHIYFDFSGYSDMAIGLGRMFGFHFEENFNYPYVATSITDFWRRWHISLSSWFRDYVYIPLGGNRRHTYLNLAIVFLLTGIWHGAAWNFIVWGIWHGVFRLIERFILTKKSDTNTLHKNSVKSIIGWVYTFLVVNFGWVLFRAEGLYSAWQYIKSMFGLIDVSQPVYKLGWYLDKWTVFILIIAIIIALNIPKKLEKVFENHIQLDETMALGCKYLVLLLIFTVSIMQVVSGTYNPFIYFRF